MPDIMNMPIYQKIIKEIKDQIEANLLQPGDRLPTEYQLMERYQVSRITISRALNELKNEGIIERFPHRGTFISRELRVPSPVREAAAEKNPKASEALLPEVACILPHIPDPFAISLVNGVLSAFHETDFLCHIFQSITPQMENYQLKRCLELNIAGIVLFPQDRSFFSDELLSLQLQKYPLVFLDRYLPYLDTSYVISDGQTAGELCVRHLHGLGHRRIAFITESDHHNLPTRQRIEGVQAAAAARGLPDVLILEKFDSRINWEHYQSQFNKLVKEMRITAFITSESHVCAYLYDLFTSLKLKVPGDISLMTFDSPLTAAKSPAFFTHINQSELLMGKEAGTILRRRIEQHDRTVYHRVISPSLEIGRSTDAAVI